MCEVVDQLVEISICPITGALRFKVPSEGLWVDNVRIGAGIGPTYIYVRNPKFYTNLCEPQFDDWPVLGRWVKKPEFVQNVMSKYFGKYVELFLAGKLDPCFRDVYVVKRFQV